MYFQVYHLPYLYVINYLYKKRKTINTIVFHVLINNTLNYMIKGEIYEI